MSKSSKKKNNKIELSSLQEEVIKNIRPEDDYYINTKTKELMFKVVGEDDMHWAEYRTEILGEEPIKVDDMHVTLSSNTNYYIDKKEMLYEILISKENGELTPRATQMFLLLGKRIMKRLQKRYRSKEDQADCMQTGMYHLFKSWHKFDPRQSDNPFAYYTQIFKTGAADGYNKLFRKKGDPDNNVQVLSYTSANEGNGMFNIN